MANNSTVTLTDPLGFRVSNLTQQVQVAGTTKRIHATQDSVQFDNATVTLSGTVNEGEIWTLKLGGVSYSYTVESNVTDIPTLAGKLRDAITETDYTKSVSGSAISLSRSTPFTVEFAQSGVDPQGIATIQGTPAQSTLSSISFASADVTLTGSVRPHETWTVTLDGTPYSYRTSASDNTTTVANGLRSRVPAAYAPASNANTLTLTKNSGFTVGYSITPGTDGTATVSPTPAPTQTFDAQRHAPAWRNVGVRRRRNAIPVHGRCCQYTHVDRRSVEPRTSTMQRVIWRLTKEIR